MDGQMDEQRQNVILMLYVVLKDKRATHKMGTINTLRGLEKNLEKM